MTTSTVAPGVLQDRGGAVTEPEARKERIAPALGRIASGVYIVTTKDGGQCHGVMATWVAQAGFQPPKVTLAFNKERQFLESLSPGRALALNILSSKNMDIFKNFAAPAADGMDRFNGLALLERDESASPVFAEAVSFLDCQVQQMIDGGDHLIVLAEVVDGGLLNQEPPMTHVRKDGYKY